MENLDYLKIEYENFIISKDDLIRTLDLTSKISHNNSPSVECNSLTFIPDWNSKSITLAITNTLTYFRSIVELVGDSNYALKEPIAIKVETLNKLKNYFKDKILIYKKDENYYIRLIDGDLLLNVNKPNLSKLTFAASNESILTDLHNGGFGKILSSYRNMIDDYSDKWLAFDGEKLSLCGLNFYAETKMKTPIMCLLMDDIDLIVKLSKYYYNTFLTIYSTTNKNKLHLKINNIEIEILNVISNINNKNIQTLSSYIAKPSCAFETSNMSRIINLALALPELEKDCKLHITDDKLSVILNSRKGSSEFDLKITNSENKSEVDEVNINVNTLNKIISSFNEELCGIALYKIYTTICTEKIKVIVLNKQQRK